MENAIRHRCMHDKNDMESQHDASGLGKRFIIQLDSKSPLRMT